MNAETTFELRGSRAAEWRKRRLRFLLPIVVFAALLLTFTWSLNHNPGEIPSALIGRPVPQFSLLPVRGRMLGLSNTDLVGEVCLVNVFASWCVAAERSIRF
jgi:cytochrome c biogenesis protein CcmG/thiol:disulfide interchange protein DsbE